MAETVRLVGNRMVVGLVGCGCVRLRMLPVRTEKQWLTIAG